MHFINGPWYETLLVIAALVVFAFGCRTFENRFVAKIGDANAASLGLFARLGFRVARAMPHFEETHMALDLVAAEAEALCAAAGEITLP